MNHNDLMAAQARQFGVILHDHGAAAAKAGARQTEIQRLTQQRHILARAVTERFSRVAVHGKTPDARAVRTFATAVSKQLRQPTPEAAQAKLALAAVMTKATPGEGRMGMQIRQAGATATTQPTAAELRAQIEGLATVVEAASRETEGQRAAMQQSDPKAAEADQRARAEIAVQDAAVRDLQAMLPSDSPMAALFNGPSLDDLRMYQRAERAAPGVAAKGRAASARIEATMAGASHNGGAPAVARTQAIAVAARAEHAETHVTAKADTARGTASETLSQSAPPDDAGLSTGERAALAAALMVVAAPVVGLEMAQGAAIAAAFGVPSLGLSFGLTSSA